MRQDALNSQGCGTSVHWPVGKEGATEHATDVSTTTNPESKGRESHRNSQKTVQKSTENFAKKEKYTNFCEG